MYVGSSTLAAGCSASSGRAPRSRSQPRGVHARGLEGRARGLATRSSRRAATLAGKRRASEVWPLLPTAVQRKGAEAQRRKITKNSGLFAALRLGDFALKFLSASVAKLPAGGTRAFLPHRIHQLPQSINEALWDRSTCRKALSSRTCSDRDHIHAAIVPHVALHPSRAASPLQCSTRLRWIGTAPRGAFGGTSG